jgi:very-short-patch-repair endonuclease
MRERGEKMYHNKNLTNCAQELRRNMTKEEQRLWYEYLRDYPKQFRRQVTCGRFILDFYCAAAKLAIEVDGSRHYEQEGQVYDQQRTAYLNSLGIEALRFSNTDVMKNLRGVCQMIDLTVTQRLKDMH